MTEEKNNRKEEPFIQEKIAGPAPKKRRKKIAFVLGLSVLAGILAAVAFALTLWILPNPKDKIDETVSETPQETEPPETEPEETEPQTQPSTEESTTDIGMLIEQYLQEQTTGMALITDYVQELYEEVSGSLIDILVTTTDTDWMYHSYEEEGTIQGVIIRIQGGMMYILMDGGELEGEERYRAVTRQGLREAQIYAKDQISGIQILSVDVSDLSKAELEMYPAITFAPNAVISPGDFIMAVGNPTGTPDSMDFGFVTYRGKSSESIDIHYDMIYTDMKAYEGASGLFIDEKGRAVGWITDQYKTSNFEESMTALSAGSVSAIVDGLLSKEPVGYLGIISKDVTTAQEEQVGTPYGVYVTEVLPDSPAFASGLQIGDVIVKCGIENIYSTRTIQLKLFEAKEGDTLKLKVLRWSRDSYKEVEVSVVLSGRP